jgi:hypothetical protein
MKHFRIIFFLFLAKWVSRPPWSEMQEKKVYEEFTL